MVATCLQRVEGGVLIQVKALAAAKLNGFRGIENGRLRVATTAVPEKGKANRAIGKLLANQLKLPARDVELIRGEIHPQKTFLLRGIDISEANARLQSRIE